MKVCFVNNLSLSKSLSEKQMISTNAMKTSLRLPTPLLSKKKKKKKKKKMKSRIIVISYTK